MLNAGIPVAATLFSMALQRKLNIANKLAFLIVTAHLPEHPDPHTLGRQSAKNRN